MSVNLKFSVAEILSRAAQLAENLDRADGQKDGSIFASEWNKFARKNKLPKIDISSTKDYASAREEIFQNLCKKYGITPEEVEKFKKEDWRSRMYYDSNEQ